MSENGSGIGYRYTRERENIHALMLDFVSGSVGLVGLVGGIGREFAEHEDVSMVQE